MFYKRILQAISSVKRNGCGIKGNIETKMNRPDIKSRNVQMRNELDLFVNVLKCVKKPSKSRQTTSDFYDLIS